MDGLSPGDPIRGGVPEHVEQHALVAEALDLVPGLLGGLGLRRQSGIIVVRRRGGTVGSVTAGQQNDEHEKC
jgi:hypothetical protein